MRLTVTTFVTLDGVYQAPGGPGEDDEGGFRHGGWSFPYADEDFGAAMVGWFTKADAFLLGRKTYDIFVGYWPKVTDPADPIASRLNALPKYVVSGSKRPLDWHNSHLVTGDVPAEIAKLKQLPGGELQVHGSGNLVRTLIRHGLADEYQLLVYPVILGTGKRLFPDGDIAAALRLTGSKTTGKGVQILTTIEGRELSDPDLEVFWAKAEQLGAVILIHPNGFTQGERLRRHYYNNVIGNPLETTIAIHNLIFDGVLERHPKLKIIVVHGGGYVAGYAGRMDHAWGARSDARGILPNPPTTYLKRLFFDTVVFSNEQLEALVKLVGVDHVVMGTDYPFDMAENDPVGHVTGCDFDDKAVEAICGGNARKLLGR